MYCYSKNDNSLRNTKSNIDHPESSSESFGDLECIACQCRVRRHRRWKHRVVRDVPQQRTQHRTLWYSAVHRPLSHPAAPGGVDDAPV